MLGCIVRSGIVGTVLLVFSSPAVCIVYCTLYCVMYSSLCWIVYGILQCLVFCVYFIVWWLWNCLCSTVGTLLDVWDSVLYWMRSTVFCLACSLFWIALCVLHCIYFIWNFILHCTQLPFVLRLMYCTH